VKTGQVHGRTAARHTSDEFVAFLHQVVQHCKRRRSILFWTTYPRTRPPRWKTFCNSIRT
jgi:hypothetical protein